MKLSTFAITIFRLVLLLTDLAHSTKHDAIYTSVTLKSLCKITLPAIFKVSLVEYSSTCQLLVNIMATWQLFF